MTYSNMWPRGNWASTHLNWTLVLFSWLSILPLYLIVFLSDNEYLTLPFLFLSIVLQWYLSVWNLKHKGRSLKNLLYLLIPWVGFIFFLCVSNQAQLAVETDRTRKQKQDLDEYKKEHGWGNKYGQ